MRPEIKGTNPLAVYAIATGETIVEGDLVAIDSSQEAYQAADASGMTVVGCAVAVNADGTEVEVRDGTFQMENSVTHAVDRENRGSIVYVEDENTVSSDPGSHAVVAGVLVDVDGDDVYVDCRPASIAAATGKNPVAAVVAGTVAALTLTAMTGTANTAPAAEVNIDTLTGTLTGTLDNILADVAATAGSCAGSATPAASDVDTAIATAVASIVTGANKNFKEIQAELVTQLALNAVLINDVKTFATQINAARTDINAILVALKAAGLMASA